MINENIRHIIEAELQSDEKLLWADKPSQFPFSGKYFFVLLFVVIWCSLTLPVTMLLFLGSVPTEQMRDGPGAGLLFKVIPLLFWGFGLLMLFMASRFFFAPSRQIYGLTDRRAIIVERFLTSGVHTIHKEELSEIVREGHADCGSLIIRKRVHLAPRGWPYYQRMGLGFYKIKNPKLVENLIHMTFFHKDPSHEQAHRSI